MPDIVERLRAGLVTPELLEDAAVTIEQLRYALAVGRSLIIEDAVAELRARTQTPVRS